MINDCKYLVNDGFPASGGCSKCFMSCPYYIRDNMDMACGGACYEPQVEEEEMDKESESDSDEDNQK